jgi:uncharacterized protein (TIGR02646 family)
MKRIVKGREPEALRLWREQNASIPENLKYDRGNWPTRAVKAQMLAEQGYLCAYTMQSITTEDHCHIEHVVPQSQPGQPLHFDIDYHNLLACSPGNQPPPNWNPKYPYGAQFKGAKYIDENNFVSPLREDVEKRFHYGPDGSVIASTRDTAVVSTIRILYLDHPQLVELRKAAINELILDADPPLSVEEAEVLSVDVMAVNSAGRFPEFCLAISQVAEWYARMMREPG